MSGTHLIRTKEEEREMLFNMGRGLAYEMELISNVVQNDMSKHSSICDLVAGFNGRVSEFQAKLEEWRKHVVDHYVDGEGE